jgi:hypothetical protein
MKSKIYISLFLLMCVGVIQISAQNSRDVYDWPVPELIVNLDIYCDGVLIDQIQNTDAYTLKCRDKYQDGIWKAWNQQLKNVSFISLWTQELFVVQGHEKGTWTPETGLGEFRFIAIGSHGNRYIVHITYNLDPVSWILTPIEIRSICH